MSETFEQWLKFVFDNPVREREWYWDEDFGSRWEALELTDALIVQYMTRLFLEPEVLRPYSLDHVEQGLWFLIGESSPGRSGETLLRREAALLDRVACIHAMSSFFRNFILAVTPCQFDRNAPTVGVEGVAYMWWDIFPMQSYLRSHLPGPTRAALWPVGTVELGAELHGAFRGNGRRISIRDRARDPSSNSERDVGSPRFTLRTCRFSALHGLGHWHAEHPEQVEQIVDAFLSRHKDLRHHLIEYASRARLGNVL